MDGGKCLRAYEKRAFVYRPQKEQIRICTGEAGSRYALPLALKNGDLFDRVRMNVDRYQMR